jgi:ribosomal protein S18 acetylase RimI-like enzyme
MKEEEMKFASSSALPSGYASTARGLFIRCFEDDPWYRWISPIQHQRRRLLSFRFSRYLKSNSNVTWCTASRNEEILGFVILEDLPADMPPAHSLRGLSEIPRLIRGLSVTGLARNAYFAAWSSSIRRANLPSGGTQVAVVAVAPSVQHQGVGTRLLSAALTNVSMPVRPWFLETSKLTTMQWYRKFGFATVGSFRTSGLQTYFMVHHRPDESSLDDE